MLKTILGIVGGDSTLLVAFMRHWAFLYIALFFAVGAVAQDDYLQNAPLPTRVETIPEQAQIQLTNPDETLRLNSLVKIFEEEEGTVLSIDDILQLRSEFTIPLTPNPNYGFGDNGVWFHLNFSNFTDTDRWVADIGYAQNDYVDFYLVLNNEVIAQTSQGKLSGQQMYRLPTMKMHLADASSYDLFIRVQSHRVARIVPIDFQGEDHHTAMVMTDTSLWGIFYGGLTVLALYNLVIFAGKRDATIYAYVSYLLSVLIWQIFWGGQAQILGHNAAIDWVNQHINVAFMIVSFLASMFTMYFLDAKHTAPKSYYLLRFIQISLIVMTIIIFTNSLPADLVNMLLYGLTSFAVTCYVIAGFESYSLPYRPARYFIFAWSVVMTTALIGMLSLLGVMPSNTFTSYCFQAGVFCEAALFSIAILERSRHNTEQEIESYTREMQHNFEVIEEQNVHLDIARKHAIKASEVKSQFLANMSHEIRTPLNAVLGFSKELQTSDIPSEKREHAAIINNAATNLLNIINDILDFSKIEAGKLQVTSEPFDPEQTLEETLGLISKTALDKGLHFIYEPAALPSKLIGDASRIRQILTNLLGNAIKFTSSGHVRLKVTGQMQKQGSYWLTFEVQDTGIGISPLQQSKLFKAFGQVEQNSERQFQGTGLGLVISQQLARLMHGDITVESELDQGSKFTAQVRTQVLNSQSRCDTYVGWQKKSVVIFENYLPAKQALTNLFRSVGADVLDEVYETPVDYLICQVSERMSEQLRQKVTRYPAKQRILLSPQCLCTEQRAELETLFDVCLEQPMLYSRLLKIQSDDTSLPENTQAQRLRSLPEIKLLAVDDMELNLRLISTWLKDSPIHIATSLSGQDAVIRCEKEEYDLILMDVQMPNMDGLQTSKLIRRTDLNSGTPIVAVTAHAFKEEQERLLSSGMDDYLPKPIEFEGLIDLIIRWCAPPDEAKELSVDWLLAMHRSNNNEALAKDMLRDFVKQLPPMQQQVIDMAKREDTKGLLQVVHALHGACCYTGVPRLQKTCDEMETHLKLDNLEAALVLLSEFNLACEEVIIDSEKTIP